jgi:triacylglycerol lipase
MRQLRGLKSLVHDGVDGVTFLVGDGHDAVARRAVQVGRAVGLREPIEAVDALRAAITGASLGAVRAVNRAVQVATDAALDAMSPAYVLPAPIPLRSDALVTVRGAADALIGLLNGVVGDHLEASGNGLAVEVGLRWGDRWLDLDAASLSAQIEGATPRLVVLVHGLSATETSWCLDAERALGAADAHYGSLLERDIACRAVYFRYNSGRPLSICGELLADTLERLIEAWPVPVEELVLVGHSMGGLVCRAAVGVGVERGSPWVSKLGRLVAIGSPHQGAPLARGAEALSRLLRSVDTPGTLITGKLLEIRSLGIRDLQQGADVRALPLLPQVRYAFFAGSLTRSVNPVTKVLGDLLVPVRSAEGPVGEHGARVYTARFPGVAHHALQANAGVYEELRAFVAGERDAVLVAD